MISAALHPLSAAHNATIAEVALITDIREA